MPAPPWARKPPLRRRSGRQSAPRSHGHAPLLRLPHGRLFRHWLKVQRHLAETPRIFHVNWFARTPRAIHLAGLPRKHEGSEVDRGPSPRPRHGRETPIGWMPRYDDIEWSGMDFPKEQFDELQAFDHGAWRAEVVSHEELFIDLHDHLPPEIVYEENSSSAASDVPQAFPPGRFSLRSCRFPQPVGRLFSPLSPTCSVATAASMATAGKIAGDRLRESTGPQAEAPGGNACGTSEAADEEFSS